MTEQLAVNTIKTLAMDAVQAANSGHPGAPMGMADLATVLWTRFLTVDPTHPDWFDRDRFVVSNGHASMLLYALLHLSGFPLTLDDIKNFRQFGFPTAGHPEREMHLGIETTTGPLGQGFGTAIGMAIAEAHMRAVFGESLVNHRTYALVSDGDLMEGVSYEAASLAGHLGLGRVTYIYDDNEISIEGSTDLAFSDSVAQRFQAAGWHTVDIDGHDREAVEEAIRASLGVLDQPSLIIAHTHIGAGSPNKQDTRHAHGEPLGVDEVALTKSVMGWEFEEPFHVPQEAYDVFSVVAERGRELREQWESRRDAVLTDDPELAELWTSYFNGGRFEIPDLDYEVGASVATRKASGKSLEALAAQVPNLVGGSADLAPSTNTVLPDSEAFSAESPAGRNFHFGIREHAMGTVVNGMAIHGGLRPYGATFLVFSDYMRPAIRISALMEAPSIWVFTHDSIFLGEDGPTHQPIEHLASLRAIPNLWVVRPANTGETAEAWELALKRTDGPTALILTRQGLPVVDRSDVQGGLHKGGYVVTDGSDAVLIATGSEVWVASAAAELVDGHSIRVVSMPCVEAFDAQPESYRNEVLGDLRTATLEAGSVTGWHRFAGRDGLTLGIDHFGASAPYQRLAEEFGFTPEVVATRLSAWLSS
ncbi:MAG: transketolase [Acidimicrobiia bacterium]|nr:transketolase [Acidimicrobiia bacterium]